MPSRQNLAGKVVLITGAARGIGAEAARLLAQRGARLALLDKEPPSAAQLEAELGPGHARFEADVTDQASVDAAAAATVEGFGGIDVVLANAGVFSYGTVRQIEPHAFARTVDTNLTGVFRTAHATLPYLIESKGYLLVVASMASFAPFAGLAAYGASKAGAESLALATRQEVAHLGVDVGVCHPSWIDTDMVDDAMSDLPTLRRVQKLLPWPAHSTTPLDACARAVVDGMERRVRRIYVPRGVLLAQLGRTLLTSRVAELVTLRKAATLVPELEADVAAVGRPHGLHTPGQTPR